MPAQLGVYDEIPTGFARGGGRRGAESPSRCRRAAGRGCRKYKGGGKVQVEDLAWRQGTVQERLTHALVRGITTYIVEDTEEARLASRLPGGGDRRPLDDRHERGRRPVRRGQNVFATSGEIRARNEAGSGASGALHRSGKTALRRQQTKGKIVIATVKGDVHDIGKNIVTRGAAMQQLRSDQHGRDGAVPENFGHGARAQRRHNRPVRLDHALAGRNGACGQGDAAPRIHHPVADRRRDHFTHAHGGENRAQLYQRRHRVM